MGKKASSTATNTTGKENYMCSNKSCIALLFLMLFALTTAAGAYTGSLSSLDGGLLGSGYWFTSGTTLTYDVSYDTVNGWWDYCYRLTVQKGDISHFIIEISPGFSISDLISPNWPQSDTEIGDYHKGNGNLGMPVTVHGVKFDEVTTKDLIIRFSSYRMPVWGDFYSKDGNAGGEGPNYVYNAGFADPDPTEPIGDDSLRNHILVPDTVVPEPATITCLGLGLAGILAKFKKQK